MSDQPDTFDDEVEEVSEPITAEDILSRFAEAVTDLAEADESELWYLMTQQRFAHAGISVGVDPEQPEDPEDPKTQAILHFPCYERYKHDLAVFCTIAQIRGELTIDLVDAMRSEWPVTSTLVNDEDEYVAEMERLNAVATEIEDEQYAELYGDDETEEGDEDTAES